jgi:cytochrome bd-type quinol oxidase subunit 2
MESTEKLSITNSFFMIIEITAGLLMFTNKAMFWATITYIIGVFFQSLILLGTIQTTTQNSVKDKMKMIYDKGLFLFIYIFMILGVYIYCIGNSRSNIQNDTMPSEWSWYATIISIILLCFITPILNKQVNNVLQSVENKNNQQYGFIICHILLIFVFIQYIISMFYQADGFTV